jgi:hypothetical protein
MAIEMTPDDYYDLEAEAYAPYDDEWDDEDDWGDPCSRCGPWCDSWLGDGLCELEIDYQARCQEFYDKHYVFKDQKCPICGKALTLYKVPGDLWTWPGDWLTPMIALDIYAVYDCPKGVVHSFGKDFHHVWIGSAKPRECLIATNCVRLEMELDTSD